MKNRSGIPATIKVGGITYTVEVRKEWPAVKECDGVTDLSRHRIWIRADDTDTREVVLHELVHCLYHAIGKGDIEEREVELMTTALLAVVVDNPSLIRWLANKKRSAK